METLRQRMEGEVWVASPTRLEGMETIADYPIQTPNYCLRPALRGWKLDAELQRLADNAVSDPP
jgi:hypothetical protein